MKPIVIVIDDRRREELYSKLSYLSSMIPIRQERRRDTMDILAAWIHWHVITLICGMVMKA